MAQTVGQRTRALVRRAPAQPAPAAAIHGRARLGKRTKDLVKRLGPGDIAVIDHRDLDRMGAEDLVSSGVEAVVNVAPSSSGRYPNVGPLIVARAGVRLLDVETELFDGLRDGDELTIAGAELRRGEEIIATGRVLGVAELEAQLARQRDRIDHALAEFAENTMARVREEGEMLAGEIELPKPRTRFRDRHVLIVVRGTNYKHDLVALRAYIQDVRPLLVGVDGGADAIIEAGLTPDVVLGDMDSASDEALQSGAELIVHAYRDGRAPGKDRLERLGLEHLVAPAVGTSEDVAMLLAFEEGAELIVSVGAHFNLVEFLDKNRAGMSSTFLTRLRIGETLVDAKGVSRLYNPGVSGRLMALFLAASLALVVVVVLSTPALENLFELLWLKLRLLLGW
jgi:uncharacterized membrane-anchored protein